MTMKKVICTAVSLLLLCGCSVPMQNSLATAAQTTQQTTVETTQPPPPDPIELLLDSMTTQELVGQMFLIRYPGDDAASEAIKQYHVGSFLLFAKDFEAETPHGISTKLSGLQVLSRIPLIFAVDEEGGSVTRISCHSQYRSSRFSSPRKLYNDGGIQALLDTEKEKCQLLRSLGLNVNLAPVCDIATQKTAFMYSRSLRQSPQDTASIITQTVQLMQQEQIGSVLKHFPGYGNNTDTHTDTAVDDRSLQELEGCDLVPFRAGIDAGCGAILISHTIVSCFDSEKPASLSPAVLNYLRTQMGFNGVAVTDDLVMDAITDTYGAGEAAVLAVLAGNDLLCSSEYPIQYQAVLDAVTEGRISPERIREAAGRVLRWKQRIGLTLPE